MFTDWNSQKLGSCLLPGIRGLGCYFLDNFKEIALRSLKNDIPGHQNWQKTRKFTRAAGESHNFKFSKLNAQNKERWEPRNRRNSV